MKGLGYLVQLVVILNTGYILSKLPKKCQYHLSNLGELHSSLDYYRARMTQLAGGFSNMIMKWLRELLRSKLHGPSLSISA